MISAFKIIKEKQADIGHLGELHLQENPNIIVVTQALWRWLWLREIIFKRMQLIIMNKFCHVMFAKTEQEATDSIKQILLHELVSCTEKLNKHLQHLWSRREELSLAFCSHLLNRGHNTNNYCEASIRIFKDVVLQRCKAFNMCAFVDFVTKTFELYHKRG